MLAMVVPGPEMVVGGVHTKFVEGEFVDDKSLGLMLRGLQTLRTQIVRSETRAELEVAELVHSLSES
jgi:hypothetical protein